MRRNVAACAQLAEMHDTGEDLGPSPLEDNGSDDAGASGQNPLYIACFHALMLGSVSLGPILVRYLTAQPALQLCRSGETRSIATSGLAAFADRS